MKITDNKKSFVRRYLIMTMAALVWLGCEEDRTTDYSEAEAIVLKDADPYLQVVTGFVPFEVGTESYDVKFNLVNGVREIKTVKLYGTFYDAGSKKSSNEKLFGEYNATATGRTVITDSFTYDELKDGLQIDGAGLPATDEDINPGSGWSFRFEGDFASGQTLPLTGVINMVLSKYAGMYVVSNSTYMRIQVDPVTFPGEGVAHWDGNEVFIGFVDENTLSYNDAWGYFATPGCKWEFDYDEEDGTVSNIVLSDGIVCASAAAELATCATPNAFKNLSDFVGYKVCEENMKIIPNDETGAHVIKLTYGYLGAGGYRQFTETLTKKVD